VVLDIAADFIASSGLAAGLLTSGSVRDHWDEESACTGMSVGGLAHHLASQTGNTVTLLLEPPPDQPPITLAEHYDRAGWAHSGLDEGFNTAIRDSANQEAADGYDALVEQVRRDLAALPSVLEAAVDRNPDAVLIPWQGWALTTQGWLTTRLMEIMVHSDDLSWSLDRPTPQFPDGAARAVVDLLTMVATGRHGQTAVVRALSRPQRAPASISAFGG
jgi:Mycothiol maleylpyruvate isomerase N-terminal domain